MNDIGTNTGVVIGQFLTLITVGLGFFVQWLRDKRQRKWDLEDRTKQRAKNAASATALEDAIAGQHKETRAAIADNTAKAEEVIIAANGAFNEANHANNKISDLNERILEIVKPTVAP